MADLMFGWFGFDQTSKFDATEFNVSKASEYDQTKQEVSITPQEVSNLQIILNIFLPGLPYYVKRTLMCARGFATYIFKCSDEIYQFTYL